jgi:hypothetical protein
MTTPHGTRDPRFAAADTIYVIMLAILVIATIMYNDRDCDYCGVIYPDETVALQTGWWGLRPYARDIQSVGQIQCNDDDPPFEIMVHYLSHRLAGRHNPLLRYWTSIPEIPLCAAEHPVSVRLYNQVEPGKNDLLLGHVRIKDGHIELDF